MKEILFLTGLFLGGFTIFGQIKKIPLTKEEVDFISKSKYSFGIEEKDFLDNVNSNNNVYYFEIESNNKTIYKGTINKWSPISSSFSFERTKVGLCFKYTDLSSDIVLELLENQDWKSFSVKNEKFICNGNYNVFVNDYNTGGMVLNHIIKGKIETKLYKLVE